MSKSRSSLEQKASQPAVTRLTRSSTSQARQAKLTQPQASGPRPPGSQRRKQTDSGLAQGLSLMTMSGQEATGPAGPARRPSAGSTEPGQSGGSQPGQGPLSGQSGGSQPGQGPLSGQSGGSQPGQGPLSGQSGGSQPGQGPLSGQSGGSQPGRGPLSGQSGGSQPGQGPLSGQSGGSQPGRGPVKPACRGGLAAVGRLVKQGRCRNVLVVTGAGISTASGIPDFRTPGTGLYSTLRRYHLPYPEAIFNIDYFSSNPLPFFSLAKELYPGVHRPNFIHYFIRMLHLKGLLLRVYTQNIDGLERACGIPDDKLVEAHGSFSSASCHLCYTPFPADEAKSSIMSDRLPTCGFCSGTVKPDIVFFGEDLPEKYFQHTTDFPKADLLIVMGTSLQIEPFASLVNTVRPGVPRLLLNREAVGPFQSRPLRRGDHLQLGDLLDSVRSLADTLGWTADIQHLMSSPQPGGPTQHLSISTTLVSSPPPPGGAGQKPSQTRATGLGRRGASQPPDRRPPKSRPGAPGPGSSTDEQSDSDTDGKSTASSSPRN